MAGPLDGQTNRALEDNQPGAVLIHHFRQEILSLLQSGLRFDTPECGVGAVTMKASSIEPPALRTKQLSKHYNQPGKDVASRAILDKISFSVARGRFIALVGPTGCGKTTLLKLIAGFEHPSSGTVEVFGKRVTRPGPDRGYLFQQPNLYPWLNISDNVAFPLRYGKPILTDLPLDKDSINYRVTNILDRIGLGQAKHLFPHQISGGMKARAALARVIVAGSQILLMDEPFAALDALTRRAMQMLLLQLRRLGSLTTGVLITHDIAEAILIADQVFILSGTPASIVANIEIPFSQDRVYEEVMDSALFRDLQRAVLDHLSPFLSSG